MTDHITALRQIVRLRERDVRYCERQARNALLAVAQAETRAGEARQMCQQAISLYEAAQTERVQAPCDPHVQLHCNATATQVDQACQMRAQACDLLVKAQGFAEQVRREWLRAQARYDALRAELEKAIHNLQRRRERRSERDMPLSGGRVGVALS
ncbi:hypothetical protein [Sphingobium aromaticiconvertens]|uniref:hypothetical protein n=1 Tax=Sphingobium aromaticiconvertens TaxID=365341 RepID=UPI003017A47B